MAEKEGEIIQFSVSWFLILQVYTNILLKIVISDSFVSNTELNIRSAI